MMEIHETYGKNEENLGISWILCQITIVFSGQLEEASTRYVLIQSSLLFTLFTYKEQSSIIISRHQLSSEALAPYFW